MNILFIGPYRQADGWGEASLSTVKALMTTGHNITLRPIFMGKFFKNYLPDSIIELEYNILSSYDVVIQNVLPHLADYNSRFGKNIVKSHFETSSLRYTSWPRRLMNMDEIWVNSRVEKETLTIEGIDHDKIKVIPQSFDSEIFTDIHEPFNEPAMSDKFIFYFIGEWVTRKGVLDLLLAYLSEFTVYEDVILLIKTTVKNQEEVNQHIKNTKALLGMYNNDYFYPSIIITNEFLPENKIYTIHSHSNCCVIPSYGESFCMPAVTAMLFGKTPIITENTGMNSYINDTNGWVVSSTPSPCVAHDRPLKDLYTGHEIWLKPDLNSLKTCMRDAFNNATSRKVKAKTGISLRSSFSHDTVGKLIGSIL
jgi:glycosyltransferase involved in cell wall biosynthesis